MCPVPHHSQITSHKKTLKKHFSSFLSLSFSLPPAPQYVSPFSIDSNLTVIWLDWAGSFSLNGYLKEYSVTESQLRVYTGFYSYLHIPRTSQKSESTHIPSKHTHMPTYKCIRGGNTNKPQKNLSRGMCTADKIQQLQLEKYTTPNRLLNRY